MENERSIVLLIDADNTQMSKLSEIVQRISLQGRIVVKRAYGNWKKESLKNWENELNRLAIKAVQQFDYVPGKNATDMALVIEAMELMYAQMYDTFVLVTSDSDYTPLAIKLKEAKIRVIGVGVRTTPESFRNVCDEFLSLENFGQQENRMPRKRISAAQKVAPPAEVHKLLQLASEQYQNEDGWVDLGTAGYYVKRAKPDFDANSYGFPKLAKLLEAFPDVYEIKRSSKKGDAPLQYRIKES